MERYDNVFAELKSRQEGAFVPFVTLGDPGPEQSLKIIDTLKPVPMRWSWGFRSLTRWRMARLSRMRRCARLLRA